MTTATNLIEPNTLEEVPSPPTASTTNRPIPSDVWETVWAVSYADLADDLMIALEVRKRDTEDTGERILLADFVVQEGYDPADLGLDDPGNSPS